MTIATEYSADVIGEGFCIGVGYGIKLVVDGFPYFLFQALYKANTKQENNQYTNIRIITRMRGYHHDGIVHIINSIELYIIKPKRI